MKIRPATAADLPALHALESRVFPSDILSLRAFRYHLKNPRAYLRVCAAARAPLSGYILMLRRGRAARLYSLAVAPEEQGKGIGHRLLSAAVKSARAQGCKKISLEVRARSHKVIKLYESFGFHKSADLPAYYGDGADGLRMIKFL